MHSTLLLSNRRTFFRTRDERLLDMLEGAALAPIEPPPAPPPRPSHDFLIVNPNPQLTPDLNVPTR